MSIWEKFFKQGKRILLQSENSPPMRMKIEQSQCSFDTIGIASVALDIYLSQYKDLITLKKCDNVFVSIGGQLHVFMVEDVSEQKMAFVHATRMGHKVTLKLEYVGVRKNFTGDSDVCVQPDIDWTDVAQYPVFT